MLPDFVRSSSRRQGHIQSLYPSIIAPHHLLLRQTSFNSTTAVSTCTSQTLLHAFRLDQIRSTFFALHLTKTKTTNAHNSIMSRFLTTTLAALAVAPLAMGHTWIEQLRNVNDKGEYVGEYGYPRNFVSKTDQGYTGDSMNWLLPVQPKVFIDETSPLCHTGQTKQEQSDKYPRLKAVPGGFVAMRYMENGHVTKVDPATGLGKPEKGGTVFVYGTTSPKEDEKLVDVLRWSQDGSGGDKRGALLSMNNFDDGRCYEINPTAISEERRVSDPNFAMGQAVADAPGNYPLFCETNVQLPKNATEGKPYTFYWVWQWNTAPNVDPGLPTGKDQYYTTCIDVDVSSNGTALTADAESKYALGPQQDAMSVAVSDFASRTAIMTDVVKGEVGPYFSGSGSATASGAPAASGTPVVSGSPVVSASASASAPAPALTQVTNIPTTMTTRPSANPKPTSASGDMVTVTDIVYVTVTASTGSGTKASATGAASASASVPASAVVSAPASAIVSAPMGGFTVPAAKRVIQRKNGAKFRGMF